MFVLRFGHYSELLFIRRNIKIRKAPLIEKAWEVWCLTLDSFYPRQFTPSKIKVERNVVFRWLLQPEARLARLEEHLTYKQKIKGSNPTLGRYFSTQVYLSPNLIIIHQDITP